ncbi:hypothetical protein BU23DRAFT_566598 [Bimuria novae-zelandiae CBS 107.79]|uniref:Uncharacterized protein n=1 Tax=Bimuria novae-zelandiae CBS 107.79 TaxID=1447943 RepID=A0A6A5VQE5_9PLEO|nr:hypothetical protein BU23DRAFT_566598 [Bimuria novae-zelandiae CBS 107.79]
MALATMMQKKLPQEIRDMIYSEYWLLVAEDCTPEFQSHWCVSEKMLDFRVFCKIATFDDPDINWYCRDRVADCRCADWHDLPTALLSSFVGLQTAREAATELFQDHHDQASTIGGPISIHISHLQQTLESDFLQMGIPLGKLIPSLAIRGYNMLRLPKQSNSFSRLSRKQIQGVQNQLRCLRSYPRKPSFHIVLRTEYSQCIVDYERFLDLSRDVYWQLRSQGCANMESWDPALHRNQHWPRQFNESQSKTTIHDYYKFSRTEWRQKYGLQEIIDVSVPVV